MSRERYYGHGHAAETFRPARVEYREDTESSLKLGHWKEYDTSHHVEYASAYPSGAVKVMHDGRSVFFPPDVAPIVRGVDE